MLYMNAEQKKTLLIVESTSNYNKSFHRQIDAN